MSRNPLPRPLRGGWSLLLLATCLGGCGPPPPPAGDLPPPRVEYRGCRWVLEGPVCVLRDSGSLTLWVAEPAGAGVRIEAGGRELQLDGTPVQGGLRFEVEPPADAAEITVTAPDGAAAWTLALDRRPQLAWWLRARELWSEGRGEAALAVIEEQVDSPSLDDRCAALGTLGNYHRDRKDGAARAVELLSRAVEVCRQAGVVHSELRNANTLVDVLRVQGRFQEARTLLDGLRVPASAPAEALVWIAYNRGLLAEQVGDSRSALHDLSEAAARAERVGDPFQHDVEEVIARQLQALGRTADAAQIFARLRRAGDPEPCRGAQLLVNYAWSLLLVLEAGNQPAEDPAPLLEQALEVYSKPESKCPFQADRRSNALLNMALAHLHAGRLHPAREALLASRPATEEPLRHHLWRLDLEGRLLLAEGDPAAALDRYRRQGEAGKAIPEARWRAAVGRARALAAAGDAAAAAAALGEAEDLLDGQSLQVPIHQGRETFVAQREAGTRLYLRLLLDRGADAEAFAVARHARARVLRGLWRGDRLAQLDPGEQERWDRAILEYAALRDQLVADDDWRLPVEELERRRARRQAEETRLREILDRAFAVLDAGRIPAPDPASPPAAGEAFLAYHPLDGGWVGFAADPQGVTTRRLADPGPATGDREELAKIVLEPFAETIAAARKLRVLAYGPLRGVDFHALPFAGDVLVAGRTVVYGLDLALAPEAGEGGRPAALVIGDPRGDLPAAGAEAETVRRTLAAGAWDVRLLTAAAADAASVRRELTSAELLHYAGHGAFAGRGGWESTLALAAGSRLSLGDVLTLERVPRWVVLSSCEAARSTLDAPAEAVAMASAFLAAGSRQVIAAARPVDDRATAELVAALYRGWDGSADLATLLRRAQLERRAADPDTDWAAFRVLEP